MSRVRFEFTTSAHRLNFLIESQSNNCNSYKQTIYQRSIIELSKLMMHIFDILVHYWKQRWRSFTRKRTVLSVCVMKVSCNHDHIVETISKIFEESLKVFENVTILTIEEALKREWHRRVSDIFSKRHWKTSEESLKHIRCRHRKIMNSFALSSLTHSISSQYDYSSFIIVIIRSRLRICIDNVSVCCIFDKETSSHRIYFEANRISCRHWAYAMTVVELSDCHYRSDLMICSKYHRSFSTMKSKYVDCEMRAQKMR